MALAYYNVRRGRVQPQKKKMFLACSADACESGPTVANKTVASSTSLAARPNPRSFFAQHSLCRISSDLQISPACRQTTLPSSPFLSSLPTEARSERLAAHTTATTTSGTHKMRSVRRRRAVSAMIVKGRRGGIQDRTDADAALRGSSHFLAFQPTSLPPQESRVTR